MKIDEEFARTVIRDALRAGAAEAEVYMVSSERLSIEIKDQLVDSLTSSLSRGYSLRVIRDGRLGFSFSNGTEEKDSVIRNAIESSAYADEDIHLGLPEPSGSEEVGIYDPALAGLSRDEAISRVMLLESGAYAADKRIKKIRKAAGTFTSSEVLIANSRSVSAGYSATSCTAQILAIAESGEESRSGWDFSAGRFLADVSFGETGRGAAERAVRLLGSRRIERSRADIILDNSTAVEFLGVFASSLSAEAVQKNKSLLAGKLGRQVMSTGINLTDSALLPGRLGSRPVDDEGVKTKSKILVSEGVLQSYLFNTYTARKEKTVSTGNAVRGWSSLPSVGITNFFLEPAPERQSVPMKRLIGSVGKGLYVLDAMGIHTINPISGEFSIGVTGLWIEQGEIKYPVNEAVISGNLLDFFGRIEATGDDFRFFGNIGSPSLFIPGIDISA